mgnify:CR=1 FL=1
MKKKINKKQWSAFITNLNKNNQNTNKNNNHKTLHEENNDLKNKDDIHNNNIKSLKNNFKKIAKNIKKIKKVNYASRKKEKLIIMKMAMEIIIKNMNGI